MAQIDYTPPLLRFLMKVGSSWNFKFRLVRQGTNEAIFLNNVQVIAHILINDTIEETLTEGFGIENSNDFSYFIVKKNWTTINVVGGTASYTPPIQDLALGIYKVQIILIDANGVIFYPVQLEVEVVAEATDSTTRTIPPNIQELVVQEGVSVSINSLQNPFVFSYNAGKLYIQIGNNQPEQLFDFSTLDSQIPSRIVDSVADLGVFLGENPTYEGQIKIDAVTETDYPIVIYRIAGRIFSTTLIELDENLQVIDTNNSII